jgi:hypothetical protein
VTIIVASLNSASLVNDYTRIFPGMMPSRRGDVESSPKYAMLNCHDAPIIDQCITFLYTRDLAQAPRSFEHILDLLLARDQGDCRIYHRFLRDPIDYLIKIQSFLEPFR